MNGCKGERNTHQEIWSTSMRTLTSRPDAYYEDRPFCEQLQYAMDVRSSPLCTNAVSHGDRLARQAII